MNLEQYTEVIRKIHALLVSEPGLSHLAPDVGRVLAQAEALASGQRDIALLEPAQTRGIPTAELAKGILEVQAETAALDGTEDAEFVRAFATVERNMALCLYFHVLDQYPELVRRPGGIRPEEKGKPR